MKWRKLTKGRILGNTCSVAHHEPRGSINIEGISLFVWNWKCPTSSVISHLILSITPANWIFLSCCRHQIPKKNTNKSKSTHFIYSEFREKMISQCRFRLWMKCIEKVLHQKRCVGSYTWHHMIDTRRILCWHKLLFYCSHIKYVKLPLKDFNKCLLFLGNYLTFQLSRKWAHMDTKTH